MKTQLTQVVDSSGRLEVGKFGKLRYWTGSDRLSIEAHDIVRDGFLVPVDLPEQGGIHIGIEWDTPRQFSKVVVEYADEVPDPENIKLQYWQHTWPAAHAGGWTATDDPYNGKWVTAHDNIEVDGNSHIHTFDPLDFNEIRHATDFAVFYRESLKVRLLYRDGIYAVSSIRVYSDSVMEKRAFQISFEQGKKYSLSPTGSVRIFNGDLLEVSKNANGLQIEALITECDSNSPDRTVITVKSEPRSFSFDACEAAQNPILIDDLGVVISAAGSDVKREMGVKAIYDRILDEPEQSYERASKEIPQLIPSKQGIWGRYLPLGCDSNRQEFALRFNGHIFMSKFEAKMKQRDTAKILWPGDHIQYRILTGDPVDLRERDGCTEQSLKDGFLPIVTTSWKDREIFYSYTAFAALLDESPWNEEQKRGDEPSILLARMTMRNTTEDKLTARFSICIESPEYLEIRDVFLYATGRLINEHIPDAAVQHRWNKRPYDKPRLRAHFDCFGKGEVKTAAVAYGDVPVTGHPNALVYDVELEPRSSHTVEFKIPFITFTGEDGRNRVKAADYDARLTEIEEYWRKQVDSGAGFILPDELLTDFNKANVPHVSITSDKDVKTGLYMLGAGTYAYDVFGTETVDQARSLDLRGYHQMARRYLMPFIKLQGSRRMDGRFSTAEGTLHGLRVDDETDYQVGDYSLDHPTILWWLAEHYKLTRDKAWLQEIAPNLVAACDYISNERKSTMKLDDNGEKVWEYGLLPPAHLDDNPEWQYWFINNTLSYRAMKCVAEVLDEIAHPDSKRIGKEADNYGSDIKRSMKISMELAPAVRLQDGSSVPFQPSRACLRGRDVGWIRDSLYGPIHSIDCGLIDYDSIEAEWIMKDYEDNVFVSRSLGRQVDLEKFWFSQGGITIQSNLLPNTLVYLRRNQPEHAIRAFFNSLAANIYPDVRCNTEHPVSAYGLGAGPFYKTPDECAFLTWMRYLLIDEDGDKLVIGRGIPRAWLADGKEIKISEAPTYYGPMSFHIRSFASQGTIEIDLTPPTRSYLSSVELHVRHPEKLPIKAVTVNGKSHAEFEAGGIIRLAPETGLLRITVGYGD